MRRLGIIIILLTGILITYLLVDTVLGINLFLLAGRTRTKFAILLDLAVNWLLAIVAIYYVRREWIATSPDTDEEEDDHAG